jgi:tetratricopeptide (TPR) repeat protein/HAMP domain-containing protein
VGIYNLFDRFNKNTKIRTKMILLISSVLLLSVIPLSIIILNRSQEIVLKMTFEICTNLAENIANVAREELLINQTYDTTKTAIAKLKESNITGLEDSYVINIDGYYVADLNEKLTGNPVSGSLLSYFSTLEKVNMTELKGSNEKNTLLQFSYPISIEYRGTSMRVGTAVFEFNKEKVYESVVKIRTTIIGVASVIFFAGIIIAAYSAIFLSRPIQILTDGAQRIGEGDLDHRIGLQGKDELGQLAKTFNHMTAQIQDFTQNLELKVKQRTEELNKTLEEVRALKVAQDGDYYLTSLLLTPLQPNNNFCSNVKTEFYVEQKKKFTFRKWNAQIGGDICITDTIRLNGKEYTAFINGDAMGKSIQGAGGALVLGVVFNAGLMRSKVEKYQGIFPETWLKERFLDLHNVFLSFDGSMYISICMGIVDNQTGMFYYINAEHPWTVLFRDGKASFLEEELALRKLGTPGQEDNFYVRMFPLMAGDVVFTGSDGRDDLMIKSPTGEEMVQEDETEFLRRVEESKGHLPDLVNILLSKGRVIDDVSLIRISYKEEADETEIPSIPVEMSQRIEEGKYLLESGKNEEAYEKIKSYLDSENNFPELLKLTGKLYYNMGDYPRAIECFEDYLNLNPGDNEYLYALSNTYRVFGKLNLAADAGERLYLRDQRNVLNLLNLAAIYLELKVFGRANMMAEKVIRIEPDNEKAMFLQESIQKAKSTYHAPTTNSPEVIETLFKDAERAYKGKNYEEALHLYESILGSEKFNASPRILLKIANCFTHLEEYEKAIIYYNRTINEDEFNFHAYNNLGGIYFKQGLFEKARLEWKKALEIKDDFKPAETNLKRLEKYSERKAS